MASFDFEYLIIGTGFSGLGMAWKLQQEGVTDFVIFERADDVGGTWRENTYPGCACDVPAHLYSFSFEQKPDWEYLFARQPELLTYLRDFTMKYNLNEHIQFNKLVVEAKYLEREGAWQVTTADGAAVTARYIIAAPGPLATPKVAEIQGLKDFKGEMFHSAQWPADISLKEKKVAVIGTGASALQFIPEIVKEVAELTVFQRTASWVIPRNEKKFSNTEKKYLSQKPGVLAALRNWLYGRLEMRAIGFTRYPFLLSIFEIWSKLNLRHQIKDPALRAKLTPEFKFGCKRILLSTTYYPAIADPKTTLVTDPITNIDEEGINTSKESYSPDVIILGTGFEATKPMPEINVIGADGRNLHEEWDEAGPEAYYGAFMNGYPNFFMLLGPNTAHGHNSVVYMAEAQIEGIWRVITHAQEREQPIIEVKQETQRHFNLWVQDRLKSSVWQKGGCSSWYQTADGKNVTLWPDYTFKFKKQMHNLPLQSFEFSQEERS